MKENRICLIPARGGSKRLPKKNILPFLGRPMFLWPYEAAYKSNMFDKIMVSTDDEETIAIAKKNGINIDHRSAELASDEASVVDVCVSFIKTEENNGNIWSQITVIYPTAVLCSEIDIRETVGLLESGICDFSMSITNYDHYPHLALKQSSNDKFELVWPELLKSGTKPLELAVCNGSIMASNVDAFMKVKSFYGPGLRGYKMPRERSVDIDTNDDLELALYYANKIKLTS